MSIASASAIIKRLTAVVRTEEKLTAFLEPGSRPSGGTPRGDFSQPWRGQAAARLNCRAPTPNAIKDRDNNAKEDPASGTAAVDHIPSESTLEASPEGGGRFTKARSTPSPGVK